MTFPKKYPYSPPTFRFTPPLYHPNVYLDGKLCISILHPPGDDITSGESASERWSPLQGVESVLRSVLLLLDDPEVSSPANVDASVLYRKDREDFKSKVAIDVARSKFDIPEGFVVPTVMVENAPVKDEEDRDFWVESEAEDDFGGSSSDEEIGQFNDGDESEEMEGMETEDEDDAEEEEEEEGDEEEDDEGTVTGKT